MCVLSSLVFIVQGIEYRSHNGEFLRDVSRKLERECSGYYRNLSSLRVGTRHHGGRRAPPAKRHSVSDSDIIVAYTAFILPLSLSVFACDLHTLRQLASHWTGVSQ